jgi:integrase
MSRGSGTIRKRGKIWWVQISVAGRVIRQSSKSEKYEVAERLRNKLLGQKARGELGGPNAKVTVNDVIDYFLKASAFRVQPNTLKIYRYVLDAHIRLAFGKLRPDKVTTSAILAYRSQRERDGAAFSTCNRELVYLRDALRTGAKATPPLLSLASIPQFPIQNEQSRARSGFVVDDAFEKVLAALPSYLQPLAVVGYNTGVRKGELLKVRWTQVDFDAKLIRLRAGETKAGDPRTVPFLGDMEMVLLKAKAERDEYWPDCEWVFSHLGERIKSFKGSWAAAVIKAGFPALQFHDLRRSGARNLSRAKVPERVIMSITGHKTRSMFDRYNIVCESDLEGAATLLAAFRDARKADNGGSTPKSTDTNTDTVPSERDPDQGPYDASK